MRSESNFRKNSRSHLRAHLANSHSLAQTNAVHRALADAQQLALLVRQAPKYFSTTTGSVRMLLFQLLQGVVDQQTFSSGVCGQVHVLDVQSFLAAIF